MRKDQVQPAAVDVEGLAQDAAGHGRALDVPAGATFAPGAIPRGLARLGALPEGKVGGRAFALGHLAPFAQQTGDVAVGELAVLRVAGHVKVNVAVGLVGKTLVDERLRELDDLADVVGGPGEVVDRVDAHRGQVAHVVGRHFVGQRGHAHTAAIRFVDQLVVDVGDVDHQRDLVAGIGQIALDRVEDDRPDHVSDVAGLVNRGAAEVDADLARLDRFRTALCSWSAC